MAQYKNQFGDVIDLPATEQARALASGYTAVAPNNSTVPPAPGPTPATPTVSPSNSGLTPTQVANNTALFASQGRNPDGTPTTVTGMPKATEAPITSQNSPGTGFIKGYDTNNQYAPVWVKAGQYYPGISPYPQNTNTITSNKLQPEKTTTVPGATSSGSDQSGAMIAGASQNINEIIKQLTPAQTETETKQQNLLNEMATLTGEQANKSADQLTAEQSAGIPDLKKQFADINAQILTKSAEYNVLQEANKNKPITMDSIIGNERAILNAKAADIGLLQAQAQGLQGKISVAQDTVNRAIDLKYSTKEAQLATYQAQLNALLPTLNKEEKIQAAAQQTLLDNQKQAIATAKDNETQIKNVMLEAIKAGVKDSNVLNSIASAKTLTKALQVYAQHAPAAAGDHSAIYKEWLDYKSTGGKLNFDAYQTMDANRKRSVTNISLAQQNADTTKQLVPGIQAMVKGEGLQGPDLYVSPQGWNMLKQEWVSRNGDPKVFDDTFSYLKNPETTYTK